MSDRSNRADDLSASFSKLRAHREEAAGTFAATVAGGRVRERARRAQARRRIAVALVLLLPAAGALTVQARTRARIRADVAAAEEAAAILQWQSPTETLMHNAYADWLGSTPSLGASTIQPSTPQGGSQ
jgi:hypothetical protein